MNTSGIHPVEFKVLIKQKVVEEKTEGGIIIPQDARDKEQYAEMEGILVATGTKAFDDWPNGGKPKIGANIISDRYVGIEVKGNDGEKYRLINDREILAVREQ